MAGRQIVFVAMGEQLDELIALSANRNIDVAGSEKQLTPQLFVVESLDVAYDRTVMEHAGMRNQDGFYLVVCHAVVIVVVFIIVEEQGIKNSNPANQGNRHEPAGCTDFPRLVCRLQLMPDK